jgi:hypothetical protein
MTEIKINLITAIFAKTAVGLQEVQSRRLGLAPLPRRLLILVDGKRSGKELAVFVEGHNPGELLRHLLDNGCIEAVQATAPADPRAAAEQGHAADTQADEATLAKLPEASTRTSKEVEMARNFMMNTINAVFQQNTRLTLMKSIAACRSAEEIRSIYPKWADNMRASAEGAKRLPEFHAKLFAVL